MCASGGKSVVLALLCVAGAVVLGCSMPGLKPVRDPVSAGSAKLYLEKGEITQQEVIEAFGGPNIVAGDADGNETWTYDRMSYSARSASGGVLGGAAGVVGTAPTAGLVWGSASGSATSSNTVTLFLYWESGVLVNYKYRSASF